MPNTEKYEERYEKDTMCNRCGEKILDYDLCRWTSIMGKRYQVCDLCNEALIEAGYDDSNYPSDTEFGLAGLSGLSTTKQELINIKQSMLQRHGDRRQINDVWEINARYGERYLFGRVGSGKNSYSVTIAKYNYKYKKWELV